MSMHEIDLSRVDLNLLVVFEALMRERHVGRAAARLCLSQSATSHALGRLRELLGDPLFVRHPKGVEPTARAQALAGPVREAMAGLRAILAPRVPFSPATLARRFTIGATDYAVLVVLAPLMETVQREAPGLDLRVVPVDRGGVAEAFDRGALDFAIGNFPDLPHRLEALPLFREQFVGAVRRGHPALRDGKMALADFARLPHALASPRGDSHGRVDEALAPLGLSRRVAVTVPHFLALPFLLGASDLVGVLPGRAAARLAGAAALDLFPLPLEVGDWTLHLVRPRQMAGTPEVDWFCRQVAAIAQTA